MAADYLKTEITHFDSYEPLITEIDSLFYSPEKYNEEISMTIDLMRTLSKIQKCSDKIQKAKEKMNIYKPAYIPRLYSENSNPKYDNALAEKESQEALRQKFIEKATNQFSIIKQAVKEESSYEFQGWIVYQKFKALNNAGTMPLFGEYNFICDREFKNCEGYPAKDFETINNFLNALIDSEDADSLFETVLKQATI